MDSLMKHNLALTYGKSNDFDGKSNDFDEKSNNFDEKSIDFNDKMYTSEVCLKTFSENEELKKPSLNSCKKTFVCNLCKDRQTFSTGRDLTKHLHLHTLEETFSCEFCNQTFFEVDCFKTHLLSHSCEKSIDSNEKSYDFDEKDYDSNLEAFLSNIFGPGLNERHEISRDLYETSSDLDARSFDFEEKYVPFDVASVAFERRTLSDFEDDSSDSD